MLLEFLLVLSQHSNPKTMAEVSCSIRNSSSSVQSRKSGVWGFLSSFLVRDFQRVYFTREQMLGKAQGPGAMEINSIYSGWNSEMAPSPLTEQGYICLVLFSAHISKPGRKKCMHFSFSLYFSKLPFSLLMHFKSFLRAWALHFDVLWDKLHLTSGLDLLSPHPGPSMTNKNPQPALCSHQVMILSDLMG